MKFKLLLGLTVICCSILISCSSSKHHPITKQFWINKTKTSLIKFYTDNTYADFFDFADSTKNTYRIEDNQVTIFRTYPIKDTVIRYIEALNDTMMILKYNETGRLDTFSVANDEDCIVGRWQRDIDDEPGPKYDFRLKSREESKSWDSTNYKYFNFDIKGNHIIFTDLITNARETWGITFSGDKQLMMLTSPRGRKHTYLRK